MYIGITGKKPEERWSVKGNGYQGQVFYKAIKKYGWDNFDHEIIASGLTKEEAENFEILLIMKLDTTNNEKGYNMDNGGSGKPRVSERMKDKMRGKNNSQSRKVICVTTGKVFHSLSEGADYYNTRADLISKCCLGKKNASGKYNNVFLRWMYYDDYIKYGDKTSDKIYSGIKVICLNNHKIYTSIFQASQDLKISSTQISNCCSLYSLSVNKNNENFYFMTYEDYLKFGEINFNDSNIKNKQNKIICLNDLKIYNTAKRASVESNNDNKLILQSCRNYHFKNKILPIQNKSTGEETTWMYYEDYLKLNQN